MEYDDFDSDENNKHGVNYWKLIRSVDQRMLVKKLSLTMSKKDSGNKLQKWMEQYQQGLIVQYIQGIETGIPEAFKMSLHDFGLYVYIASSFDMKEFSEENNRPVELKPQSTKLQKELDDAYNPDKIQQEIDELLGGTDNIIGDNEDQQC